jgi:uncharacterized protein (DUF1800 family)
MAPHWAGDGKAMGESGAQIGAAFGTVAAARMARPTDISAADAARFLQQAQFSSSAADIAAVRELGYGVWLSLEFVRPNGQSGCAWLSAQGYDAVTERGEYFWPQFGDYMMWNQLLTAPDQVRRRMALALSEFFVVSLDPIDGFWPPYMIGAYWDLLVDNSFGNFRTLLERVTLNAAMGMYLNTKGNLKEDEAAGRLPDENYAREIMQLFSIGLYELNQDGTLRRDAAGRPIETYTQSDITNLARVFTGYDHDFSYTQRQNVAWLDYPVPDQRFCSDPMRLDSTKHSYLAVDFLGVHIPAETRGGEALRTALDALYNHRNVGPFFGKQMIQRLVTSNPSPDYVRRVADAFDDNGDGVRGDLRAVWRAILLDPEARAAPDPANRFSGKLREPIVRLVQWAQTVGIQSTNGKFEIHSLGRSDRSLGQSPMRSPSVFNFFRPGYVPPHTEMAQADLPAPEFQLVNESSAAGYINFLQWMLRTGYNDVKPSYAAMMAFAHDSDAVTDWLNLHMAANQLSRATCDKIKTALSAMQVSAASSEQEKFNHLAAGCLLVMSAPEYLVQK